MGKSSRRAYSCHGKITGEILGGGNTPPQRLSSFQPCNAQATGGWSFLPSASMELLVWLHAGNVRVSETELLPME